MCPRSARCVCGQACARHSGIPSPHAGSGVRQDPYPAWGREPARERSSRALGHVARPSPATGMRRASAAPRRWRTKVAASCAAGLHARSCAVRRKLRPDAVGRDCQVRPTASGREADSKRQSHGTGPATTFAHRDVCSIASLEARRQGTVMAPSATWRRQWRLGWRSARPIALPAGSGTRPVTA